MNEALLAAARKKYHRSLLENGVLTVDAKGIPSNADLNSTPFVRQYDILSNKWGVLLCQKEYQTNDIRRSSRKWL